jgi:hypothetical protein
VLATQGLTMPRPSKYPIDTREHVSFRETASHTPGDDREFVSVQEAMRLTDLGRTKLYGLMGEGTLDYVKVGTRRLVVRRSISRLGRG